MPPYPPRLRGSFKASPRSQDRWEVDFKHYPSESKHTVADNLTKDQSIELKDRLNTLIHNYIEEVNHGETNKPNERT